MLKFRSGVPGTGKTNSVFDELMKGVKYPESDDLRPIYYFGVVLLPEESPTLSTWIKLSNPKMWHEEVPDGAIVFIDECQEHFPTRTRGDIPPGVFALQRHRQRGIDLYLTSQHPMLVDIDVRRQVGEHKHFKRNFGAAFSVCYTANECMDDPKDYRLLSLAAKSTYRYNKEAFKLYRSTVVDTHKFKMPPMLWVGLACLVFLIYSLNSFYNWVSKPKSKTSSSSVSAAKLDSDSAAEMTRLKLSIKSFVPVIPNVPASSPLYQPLWKPKSAPIISSCIGTDTNCRCYSQQGTLLEVTLKYCLYVLQNGSNYDHTLPDNRITSDGINRK